MLTKMEITGSSYIYLTLIALILTNRHVFVDKGMSPWRMLNYLESILDTISTVMNTHKQFIARLLNPR